MDPVSHFLVALVPLAIYCLVRYGRLPSSDAILVLLFGTQLPDLVDKPLAWTFGVLPSGRMLAHSLVVAVPFVIAVLLVAHRRGYGRLGNVFAFGYLSHLAADFYPILFLGTDYYFYPNLFWPLMSANPDHVTSFAAHVPEPGIATIGTIGIVGAIVAYALFDSYQTRQ